MFYPSSLQPTWQCNILQQNIWPCKSIQDIFSSNIIKHHQTSSNIIKPRVEALPRSWRAGGYPHRLIFRASAGPRFTVLDTPDRHVFARSRWIGKDVFLGKINSPSSVWKWVHRVRFTELYLLKKGCSHVFYIWAPCFFFLKHGEHQKKDMAEAMCCDMDLGLCFGFLSSIGFPYFPRFYANLTWCISW